MRASKNAMIENYRDDIVVSSPVKIYRRIVNFHTFWQMKSLTVHFCASCGGGGRAFEDHGRTWPSEERPPRGKVYLWLFPLGGKLATIAVSPPLLLQITLNEVLQCLERRRLLIIIYTRIH